MLLRISLIVAILAGLGVIGVSQFVLRPQIEGIRTDRDYNKTEWDKTSRELTKTKSTLKTTTENLVKTEATLEETKAQLVATTSKFESEQQRANGLQENLTQTRAEMKTAKDELFTWASLGLKVEEIKGLIVAKNSLDKENAALKDENGLLIKKVQKQADEIIALTSDKELDPLVPREVRGKVLVVDPKWDFLVLDIGAQNELPVRGVMLISRNGELVAKVRVMDVQERRSIANIMPGWKLKDVMEGDVVLAY